MKKKLLLFALAALFCSAAFAQELTVKEFRADMTMTDAVKFPKTDANGENCGLIRMGLVIADAQFEGDIISAEYKDGEWWIYLIKGANWLTIKTKKYLPLRYEFEPIQSNITYVMNIEVPQVAYDGPTGTMNIVGMGRDKEVTDADVYIDGEKMSSKLPYVYKGPEGKHLLEVRAKGYKPEKSTFEIQLNRKLTRMVPLHVEGSIDVDGVGYEMMHVAGGKFMMGSTAKPYDKNFELNYAQPCHEVVLRGFRIGRTEVTQALWEKVMGSNPSVHQDPSYPVENVTYDDCLQFIAKLNSLTGLQFRLPTEAEWEYAARGLGKGKPDECAGGAAKKVARTESVSYVSRMASNSLGIKDMSGNVAEWCSDWIHSYSSSSETNPTGPDTGVHRVVRGGYAGGPEWRMYCASRSHQDPDEPSPFIGLRLVLDE